MMRHLPLWRSWWGAQLCEAASLPQSPPLAPVTQCTSPHAEGVNVICCGGQTPPWMAGASLHDPRTHEFKHINSLCVCTTFGIPGFVSTNVLMHRSGLGIPSEPHNDLGGSWATGADPRWKIPWYHLQVLHQQTNSKQPTQGPTQLGQLFRRPGPRRRPKVWSFASDCCLARLPVINRYPLPRSNDWGVAMLSVMIASLWNS